MWIFGIYRYKYWESIGISYEFLFIFFGDDLCYFVIKTYKFLNLPGRRRIMAFRKKALAIVMSMAMVATSLSIPTTTAKTAEAAGTTFNNLNQSQITEAMGVGYNLGNSL